MRLQRPPQGRIIVSALALIDQAGLRVQPCARTGQRRPQGRAQGATEDAAVGIVQDAPRFRSTRVGQEEGGPRRVGQVVV